MKFQGSTQTSLAAAAALLFASAVKADLWFATSSGMTFGCGGPECAGNPTTTSGYFWHSGQEDDLCGKAGSTIDSLSSGIGLCDNHFTADQCGGRAIHFANCADIQHDTTFDQGKFVGDVLDDKDEKIGTCFYDLSGNQGVTCASDGSTVMRQTIRCSTLGNNGNMC